MIWITIRNHETGEIIAIDQDVRTVHPAWVHSQCGTTCESELQDGLSQCHVDDYADGVRDECGILMERCCDGCGEPLTADACSDDEN